MAKRTVYCGKVSEDLLGEVITVKGWVQKRRDLGGLIFIDLRDREGIIQVVFNPDFSKEALEIAENVRSEYVLEITGKVVNRDASVINKNIATGMLEIEANEITILNKAKTTPFYIEDGVSVSDDKRMQYRYLDLRRPEMTKSFILRHEITKSIRNYLDNTGFIDIETPYLTKSTPEGARDYLVPSRVHPGHFYALPQSPQLFKQLLMGAGFDRYYQVVRCFRDEDLRGDRQPEFTQIDIETSFLEADEIQGFTEELLRKVMKETKGIDISLPLPQMSYDEAMSRYGSDKPDIRFDLELIQLNEIVKDSSFKVFSGAIENGGEVKAINAKGAANKYSRKDIDGLGEFVGRYGAKGLAWLKMEEDGLKGPIAKFFTEDAERLIVATNAEPGDLLLFVADKKSIVADALGALRNKLGKELELIDETRFAFLWIIDWPLLEYDEENGRYTAAHHPFTMPKESDIDKLTTSPGEVYAQAYDIVLNGYELGGGSLRIHTRELQEKMFAALGFSKEEAEEQFGFLLEALDYGFPPHGGIALGLDRLAMLLAGKENIREVIAFPKNGRASDPLTSAPSVVSEAQLDELSLATTRIEEETTEEE
ncbi:aspartate--tRNA ligase [Carnobacterium divergens]|uniref:Aspartate--tRNA ligase n=1 Tax=Carnobacterium divergens TaxID=2748 RepID=A0AAW8RAH5_CARDV|nr:aspartate--tRNA ligase [Carnobacterium divergens]MDT1957882.1 aspartate--tRNA ligase [Carnobacterium divergens]MDT1973885.1 aspartate--tRNA ligase [Carnobacterium divergens]TFJ38490.1 aspartate--tRNA ligase [Carnobacterium divergens]TFJ47722.1 aspartate--tRNA ligase [Carnobacterium divergens]TFJ52687.1 aspartate--tRNA ligase [Carnobacterium divergens]